MPKWAHRKCGWEQRKKHRKNFSWIFYKKRVMTERSVCTINVTATAQRYRFQTDCRRESGALGTAPPASDKDFRIGG